MATKTPISNRQRNGLSTAQRQSLSKTQARHYKPHVGPSRVSQDDLFNSGDPFDSPFQTMY